MYLRYMHNYSYLIYKKAMTYYYVVLIQVKLPFIPLHFTEVPSSFTSSHMFTIATSTETT